MKVRVWHLNFEVAAASEELSSQAHMLKERIGQFNLKSEKEKYFDSKMLFDSEEF